MAVMCDDASIPWQRSESRRERPRRRIQNPGRTGGGGGAFASGAAHMKPSPAGQHASV